ncbi:hypothetical protein [uncultured Desulfobacter sp.]|uniref:hypothetical protein n=1 Tax=uncultured Desulfobacter sp. TaxID=240139 RepID=UPI0029F474F8|nr:hypothetical protein [uncultured Desulfobacter sp.]
MFAKCPAGRPGTADEVANVAELLMTSKGAFITGGDGHRSLIHPGRKSHNRPDDSPGLCCRFS